MGRFKGGIRQIKFQKLITYLIIYRYVLNDKYNVKTCMYTLSELYQIINLIVSA